MPRVSVILKNGTAILIEGANDAEWRIEKLAPQLNSTSIVLVVLFKEPNSVDTRGKFRAEDVAGYTVDVR